MGLARAVALSPFPGCAPIALLLTTIAPSSSPRCRRRLSLPLAASLHSVLFTRPSSLLNARRPARPPVLRLSCPLAWFPFALVWTCPLLPARHPPVNPVKWAKSASRSPPSCAANLSLGLKLAFFFFRLASKSSLRSCCCGFGAERTSEYLLSIANCCEGQVDGSRRIVNGLEHIE